MKKKNMKQKLSEYAYTKPSMDKKMLAMKKSFGEVASMLNEKKKTGQS